MALVGAGAFLQGMVAFDRDLLASIGRARPRVAILPTAAAPDGELTFRQWIELGVGHFAALGAEVEAVVVRDRAGADDDGAVQAIGEADLIYLTGGRSVHLRAALDGTRVGAAVRAANQRGATIAGCSAGAMVLASWQPEFRRTPLPWPLRWRGGLGIVGGTAVLPHYDAWPEPIVALMALQAPRDVAVLGIDEDTAILVREGGWQVHGRARVTVWRGRHRERYRRGERFTL